MEGHLDKKTWRKEVEMRSGREVEGCWNGKGKMEEDFQTVTKYKKILFYKIPKRKYMEVRQEVNFIDQEIKQVLSEFTGIPCHRVRDEQ